MSSLRSVVAHPPPPPLQRFSWPTAASASEHSEADCETPDRADQLRASTSGTDALEGDGDGSSSSSDGSTPRLPPPPNLHGKTPRRQWNANALAFLGDSVWELYVRRRFFYPPTRKDSYFGQVVHHVRAETQERLYHELLASGFLTAEEQDVLRWGRNATGVTPKRLSDTSMKREVYRAATAMECLSGYLYLTDPGRLHCMMELLGLGDAPADGGGGSSDSPSGGGQGGSGARLPNGGTE